MSCKHKWVQGSYSYMGEPPRVVTIWERCKLCQERRERPPTPEENKRLLPKIREGNLLRVWLRHETCLESEPAEALPQVAQQHSATGRGRSAAPRGTRHSNTIHRLWHAFGGALDAAKDKMEAAEKFAKSHKDVKLVWCDDDYHASSLLVLVPHIDTKADFKLGDLTCSEPYWGTSVKYIAGCTGEAPITFFLYPGHLKGLIKALVELQKRQDHLNAPWDRRFQRCVAKWRKKNPLDKFRPKA